MLINNDEYLGILNEACEFIRKAQYNAVVGANYALIKRMIAESYDLIMKKRKTEFSKETIDIN